MYVDRSQVSFWDGFRFENERDYLETLTSLSYDDRNFTGCNNLLVKDRRVLED